MRYFTFRFLHSGQHMTRDFTVVSTRELEAQTAAWALLRESEPPRRYAGSEWRIISVVIRPVIDLDSALAS